MLNKAGLNILRTVAAGQWLMHNVARKLIPRRSTRCKFGAFSLLLRCCCCCENCRHDALLLRRHFVLAVVHRDCGEPAVRSRFAAPIARAAELGADVVLIREHLRVAVVRREAARVVLVEELHLVARGLKSSEEVLEGKGRKRSSVSCSANTNTKMSAKSERERERERELQRGSNTRSTYVCNTPGTCSCMQEMRRDQGIHRVRNQPARREELDTMRLAYCSFARNLRHHCLSSSDPQHGRAGSALSTARSPRWGRIR